MSAASRSMSPRGRAARTRGVSFASVMGGERRVCNRACLARRGAEGQAEPARAPRVAEPRSAHRAERAADEGESRPSVAAILLGGGERPDAKAERELDRFAAPHRSARFACHPQGGKARRAMAERAGRRRGTARQARRAQGGAGAAARRKTRRRGGRPLKSERAAQTSAISRGYAAAGEFAARDRRRRR